MDYKTTILFGDSTDSPSHLEICTGIDEPSVSSNLHDCSGYVFCYSNGFYNSHCGGIGTKSFHCLGQGWGGGVSGRRRLLTLLAIVLFLIIIVSFDN